jgi:hypothetical protein
MLALCGLAPLASAQPGGQPNPPQSIVGKVTARANNSFVMEVKQHTGVLHLTVSIEDATRFGKLDSGVVADLAEDYLVAVFGPRSGGKVQGAGILRIEKVNGDLDQDAIDEVRPIVSAAGVVLGAPRGQSPTVGKIVLTGPLKVQALDGETEIVTSPKTRVLAVADLQYVELQPGANVLVVPMEAPKNKQLTAKMVIQTPALDQPRHG